MATIDIEEPGLDRNRVAVFILLGLVAVAVLGVAIAYWMRPPQMGADEDVFRSVDALYTAVRSRNEVQLSRCEERLRGYREAGKLPKKSADYLSRVIAKARSGRWEAATEELYEFMLAQRR
jgi:hypothetical protein